MYINPLTAIDFYKADHRRQYPDNTKEVYANFTPRSDRLAAIYGEFNSHEIVVFGVQYFIEHFLLKVWDENFFELEKENVVAQYKRRMDTSLGEGAIDVKHIEALHDLGYLPLEIRSLPEGTISPIGVPVLTIVNTHPEFFWLTNYIESILSAYLWKPMTSATIAWNYKKLLNHYADLTIGNRDFVKFQAHDFSFRGMSGYEDAAVSGAAHLTSFVGTDSVPAIDFLEEYYGADATKELVGCSVPATEHSVMCMGTEEGELETFRRLINEIYPTGIVSIVSDTWDFWKVITEFTVQLKDEILARNGKVVLRPDSGDPVEVLCGTIGEITDLESEDEINSLGHKGYKFATCKGKTYKIVSIQDSYDFYGYELSEEVEVTPEMKGAVECLWEVFGGTITDKGYKLLDNHIGLIYGDSITHGRAHQILERLERKGFASSNVVFGIGSFTYQHVTRDTFGFAVKATSGVVGEERRSIHKSPKTDSGTKKSAKGLLRVVKNEDGKIELLQEQDGIDKSLLEPVFYNGYTLSTETLDQIRNRLGGV